MIFYPAATQIVRPSRPREDARADLEAAIALARGLGLASVVASATMHLGTVHQGLGRAEDAIRLLEEAAGAGAQNLVQFTANGMTRPNGAVSEQIWLALTAEVALPQTCQRC